MLVFNWIIFLYVVGVLIRRFFVSGTILLICRTGSVFRRIRDLCGHLVGGIAVFLEGSSFYIIIISMAQFGSLLSFYFHRYTVIILSIAKQLFTVLALKKIYKFLVGNKVQVEIQNLIFIIKTIPRIRIMSKKSPISHLLLLVLFLSVAQVFTHSSTHNAKQINSKIDSTKIMYGSTIRIKAIPFNYYLHSHNVNYPLGSGQQSVTGFSMDNDYNSLWTIKEPHGEQVKTYQEQVNCGDAIRLEHALTKRNLHSEEIYQSMITKGQEISCYGHEGLGNENDNWVIKCLNKKDGDEFFGGDVFELVHENTDKKVKMSKYYEYSYANWENCPFQGQLEVSGTAASTRETQFKIIGGVFFRESQAKDLNQDGNQQL